jgi:hypothetical protein
MPRIKRRDLVVFHVCPFRAAGFFSGGCTPLHVPRVNVRPAIRKQRESDHKPDERSVEQTQRQDDRAPVMMQPVSQSASAPFPARAKTARLLRFSCGKAHPYYLQRGVKY